MSSLPNSWGDKLKSPLYPGHFLNVTPSDESISICHPQISVVFENVTPQNRNFPFLIKYSPGAFHDAVGPKPRVRHASAFVDVLVRVFADALYADGHSGH